MQKDIFKKYADIRLELAALEEQESLLKGEILQSLEDKGKDKEETDFGTFSVRSKKTWTYSKKVQKMQDDLKIQKYTEEQKGVATAEEKSYLAFSAPKEE